MAQHAPVTTPFSADPADELPVGVQLSWRLRALIASGRLGPGDALPSVRRLAEWAGVNVNTVRATYRRLEDEGLVATAHGRGTFVAQTATATPELERVAADAISEAVAAGASPRDLAIVAMVCASVPEALGDGMPDSHESVGLTEEELGLDEYGVTPLEMPDPSLDSDEATVRRELRRQIGRLEAELASYVRELSSDETDGPRRPADAHIADVEELERTRDMLMERLSEAGDAAERKASREASARSRREEMIRDPEAHRWEVVTSGDAGEPGCVNYHVVPRYGPLGMLMRWWRVKVSGGCPLSGAA